MQKFLEILFMIIKMIVVTIAFCIEVHVKIGSIILFIAIFIMVSFFAPLFSKISAPEWWEVFAYYCMHPLYFPLVKWVNKYYDY